MEVFDVFVEALYHPDVSKDLHAAELFKSIHHAYEVLSNKATRVQYDQELQFSHKPHREKWSYSTEFEDQVRVYRWAHLRKKMHSERYWEHNNVNEDYSSETEEEEDEENIGEKRGSFIEVLRSAFMSLFLFQTFGSRLSLTFSGLTALLDEKLDTGYKIAYVIAWILGGRGGILLTLCLSFASWVCGKTSSSVVALIVVAMWVGSYLARYAPLPQGALLALLYIVGIEKFQLVRALYLNTIIPAHQISPQIPSAGHVNKYPESMLNHLKTKPQLHSGLNLK
ncbi:unnamed protein product [Sphenostylis stenocarpa]|uniref:J domain-containing protein n=1 Tax=Sphenostylis stenocarpa TaxID=92480 RepID=A0AA86V7Z6_9FABA|nr:unnamed protein product [Sphenostylis stenocarpa]